MGNRLFAGLFGLSLLSACGQPTSDAVELDWALGQQWHLATSYRIADVMGETSTVDLDGGDIAVGEQWSDEVVWTYQLVEDNVVPAAGDVLFKFAQTRGEPRELDVVRAWVDPSLNDPDGLWTEAEPVVYLVFTAQRQRLAGMVSYTWENGERVERAWSSTKVGRSWAPLSQSMLSAAPTYLAPHGVTVENGERKLENGHWLSTAAIDDNTVDAIYDDEVGGGTVASRYEIGQPWPTWTVAENAEIRLLDNAEVEGLRRRTGGEPPEDYDFRAGLRASLDIDASLELAADMMSGEKQRFGTPDGYEPWNGSWWPQSKGHLVFGYDGRDTISDRIKSDIDPLKRELDGLNDDLRDLEKDSDAYKEKLETYKAKQSELVDKLVEFYDGILSDLDGGTLRIEENQLVHSDGWSYAIAELSPMDKAALAFYVSGQTYPNPFYGPAWELLNHYSPAGGSWWGHCNGWAGAAILNFEPTEDAVNTIEGVEFVFTPADQKGLLSETHYSTYSHFFGARYYKEGDDRADLTPAAFHRIITFYLRDQQVPLVFDTDSGEQVWNFPAYAATVEMTERNAGRPALVNINTAEFEALVALPGMGESKADKLIKHREEFGPFQTVDNITDVYGIGSGTLNRVRGLVTVDPVTRTFDVVAKVDFATDGVDETHVDNGSPAARGFVKTYRYELVTDENGLVLEGTWNDVKEHPDFAWVPYGNGTTATGSENGYLPHGKVVEAFGTDPSRL